MKLHFVWKRGEPRWYSPHGNFIQWFLCMKNNKFSSTNNTVRYRDVWNMKRLCRICWILNQHFVFCLVLTLTFQANFVSREFQIRLVPVLVGADSKINVDIDFGILHAGTHQTYAGNKSNSSILLQKVLS